MAMPELERHIYDDSADQQAGELRNKTAPGQFADLEIPRIRALTEEIEIAVLHRKAEANKKPPEAIYAPLRDALGQHLRDVAPK